MTDTPPKIVPRWEWRTFGQHLPPAEDRLTAMPTESVQESDEIYLLSVYGDASVKVRDALMDVKHLEQVDDHGLELWKPVMKAEFPLAANETAALLRTLGVDAPALDGAPYTLDSFERSFIETNADLRVVRVHKHRTHYDVDGCMVELTRLTADDSATLTIAIESPDQALVVATIAKLGLSGRRNTNMARGLKAMVGFGAVRYAVIDVGTNSVKFHVGERAGDGAWRAVLDRSDVTRLGEGLGDTGRLNPEPVARTVAAITQMVAEARDEYHVHGIAAVGTAGMRIAANANELIDAVESRTGVRIEVISGDEEGRLAYVAATSSLPVGTGSLVVYDSGGGSSQFSFGHGTTVDERFSVNVGAVRFAEQFNLQGVVTKDVIDAALDAIAHDLDRLAGRPRPDALIGMGGTTTNLAAVKHALATYDADVVQGTVLDLAEIDRQIEMYASRDADARRTIAGLQSGRAEVILAGACIVRTIVTRLGLESVTVCDRGLRHGLLAERFAAGAGDPQK